MFHAKTLTAAGIGRTYRSYCLLLMLLSTCRVTWHFQLGSSGWNEVVIHMTVVVVAGGRVAGQTTSVCGARGEGWWS